MSDKQAGIWLRAAVLLGAAPLLMGGTGLTNNFDQRVLAAHNRERLSQGIPPLQWNPALAKSAQAWAAHLGATGAFKHAPENFDMPEGENLWAGTKGYYPAEAMVKAWIDEKRHFKPGRFPDNSRTGRYADVGHYTQLMWRRSGQVGCARAQSRVEEVLVCRYSEAGNVIGERPF